jgi:alpha-L-arabinofuranosidase
LAESLAALHPSFLRFPGGNWIEGDDLAHMYHWKTTIGPIDSRMPLWNTWGYTTQGLGFEEYLQLCEDLDAEPLFDINCGMSLHDSVSLGQILKPVTGMTSKLKSTASASGAGSMASSFTKS